MFQVPPQSQWRPVRLVAEHRAFRQQARPRGLLGDEASTATDKEMEARAESLRLALSRPGRVRLPLRQSRQLGTLIGWLHHQRRFDLIEQMTTATLESRFSLLPRAWWSLLVHRYDDARVLDAFGAAARHWPEKKLRRLARIDDVDLPRDPRGLPGALVDTFIAKGGTIDRALADTRLPADSPLARAVMQLLLSEAAIPWLLLQPIDRVESFLERHANGEVVGRLGRRLLEPAHAAGIGPEAVQPGEGLAQVAELVFEHMPKSRSAPAWQALGPGASQVIRWWLVQHRLLEFFQEWHADPERRAFWLRCVRHISDVETHQAASALAMRIRDTWFVEFGHTGNAAYAYSTAEWDSMAGARRRATQPGHLKRGGGPNRRKAHYQGWQHDSFPRWIVELTGVLP